MWLSFIYFKCVQNIFLWLPFILSTLPAGHVHTVTICNRYALSGFAKWPTSPIFPMVKTIHLIWAEWISHWNCLFHQHDLSMIKTLLLPPLHSQPEQGQGGRGVKVLASQLVFSKWTSTSRIVFVLTNSLILHTFSFNHTPVLIISTTIHVHSLQTPIVCPLFLS